MKKLLVILDDDLAKVLEKSINKSETIREALRVYNEHIPTGVMDQMKYSYGLLLKKLEAIDQRLDRMEGVSMVKKIAPVVNDVTYTCCKSLTPCKHWVWDLSGGKGYINSLTGEVRDAQEG